MKETCHILIIYLVVSIWAIQLVAIFTSFFIKETFLQSNKIKLINVPISSLLGEIYAKRIAMMKNLGNLINDCDTDFVEKTAIENSESHFGSTQTRKNSILATLSAYKTCWRVALIAKWILILYVVVMMFHWKNWWQKNIFYGSG